MQSQKKAFTIIEMMVVVAIVGLMATIILPRLVRKPPSSEWPFVIDDINNLVFFARQEAIAHQKPHRLRFKQTDKQGIIIIVEQEVVDLIDPTKNKKFERVESPYFSTKVTLSELLRINNIFHGKQDEFNENKSEGYCYVVPNGLVQETLIRLTRIYNNEEDKASLRMKPFLGKFDFFHGHLKPEK